MGRYRWIRDSLGKYQQEWQLLYSEQKKVGELGQDSLQGCLYLGIEKMGELLCVRYDAEGQMERIGSLISDGMGAGRNGGESLKEAWLSLRHGIGLQKEVTDNIGEYVSRMMRRVLEDGSLSDRFFGSRQASRHAKELWEADGLMAALEEICLIYEEPGKDRVECILDGLADYRA